MIICTMHICNMCALCMCAKCIHSAYLYSAHILHIHANNIFLVLRIFCAFFLYFAHIQLPLNNVAYVQIVRAKYSQQYAQNVCSIFVREDYGIEENDSQILHHT